MKKPISWQIRQWIGSDNKFFAGVFGLIAGIFFASSYDLSIFWGVLFLIIAICAGAFYFYFNKKYFVSIFIFLILLGAGIVRVAFYDFPTMKLSESVVGVVSDMPDVRDAYQRIVIKTDSGVKVLVSTDIYKNISYGDKVVATGEMSLPESFTTDSGREFNYPKFLKKDGISATMSFADVEVLEHGKGLFFKRSLFGANTFFQNALASVIPEPESSLAGGITIGAKQSLGEDLLTKFREVGLIHIVVLSGYNVTIVAEAIMRSLVFLPSTASLLVGVIAIGSFAMLTGAGATVVRASIMAMLALVARSTGRVYAVTRALILAGLLMLIYNPYLLVFDPSFQLSFVATLGLIHGAPIIERFIKWAPEKFGIREIVSATIAVQIAVLPLIIFSFGNVSIVALIANLLVLPVVPAAMGLSFVAVVFSFVPILKFVLAYPAFLLLKYMLLVVEGLSALPFAQVILPPISASVLVLMYAGVFYLFLLFKEE